MSGNENANRPQRYHVQFVNLFHAVDDMSDFVRKVGELSSIDFTTVSNIRFCLHELVANSIEHAVYHTPRPEIEVTMIVDDEYVELVYKDNSEAFDTTSAPDEVNIEERIRAGTRRGLGLFMVSRLVDEIIYKRDDHQNRTVMTLQRESEEASPSADSESEPADPSAASDVA